MTKPFQTCRLTEIPIPKGLKGVSLAFEVAENVTGAGVSRGDVIGCGPMDAPSKACMRLVVVNIGFAAMLINLHGLQLGGFAAVAIVRLIIKA